MYYFLANILFYMLTVSKDSFFKAALQASIKAPG